MEDIVVIGSNSFSGSHFVDLCLSKGYPVIGISRSAEPSDPFLPYKKNRFHDNFRFYRYDLNRDLASIVELISDNRAPIVVNFAAQSMVAQSWERPEDWFRTNTLSTVMLHDRLRKLPFLKKYVHISTPEVYGDMSGTVKENTNYHPSTPYAVSRAAADMSLMAFFKAYAFPVVFTRAANVYGPGQQLYRIIPITILNFLTGQKLKLHGGGVSRRSFIHIKDVARGTLLAIEKGAPGEIFHFSTDTFISIRELVKKIALMMGVDFESHVEVAEERLGKDNAYLLDSTKAAEMLQWKPQISLEEGIAETVEWIKDNLEEFKKIPWRYEHKP